MGARIGPTIAIDGFNNYKSQMNQIIAQGKQLAAEMKETASSWDKDTSAKEKNAAKSKNLQSQIKNQEQLIAKLAEVVDKASQSQDVNAGQLAKWKTQLANAKTDLNNMKKSVEDVGEAEDDASGKTSAFGDVLKANLASEAIVAAAKAVASAVKSIATGVVNFVSDAVSVYGDYEQLAGGVETIFGEAAESVSTNAAKAFQTAGMSASEYMEAVTGFSASLIQSLGGDTEEAARVADIAMVSMSDNVNKMGTDMESVTNAYQGFAKGNYQMLDNLKLGYGGTADEMVRLINDSGVLEEEVTDISQADFSTMILAIDQVQQNLGIAGATAAEASTTLEGSASAMTAAWENLVTGLADPDADLGLLVEQTVESAMTWWDNLVPVIERILPSIASALATALPQVASIIGELTTTMLPTLLSSLGTLISGVADAASKNIGPILKALGTVFKTLASKLVENLPTILTGIVSLIMLLAQSICAEENISFIIQAVIGIINAIVAALPEMIQMVVEVLPTLISGIIDGIVENLPAILGCVVSAIIMIAAEAVKMIPELLKMVVQILQSVGKKILTYDWKGTMSNVWKRIKEGLSTAIEGVATFFKDDFWQAIANAVESIWESIKALGTKIITKVVEGLKSAISKVKAVGKNIVEGIWSGISGSFTWIKEKIKGWVDDFLEFMKELLDINSPSKVMADVIGKNMALGIGEGFSNAMVGVTKDMGATVDANVIAGSAGVAGTVVNLTVTDPSEAYTEYLFDKFNVRLAGVIA